MISAVDILRRWLVILTSPGDSGSSYRTSSALAQWRGTYQYWPSRLLVKSSKTERNAVSGRNLKYEKIYSCLLLSFVHIVDHVLVFCLTLLPSGSFRETSKERCFIRGMKSINFNSADSHERNTAHFASLSTVY